MPFDPVLISNDAVVLGLLAVTLGAIFYTEQSDHPIARRFYRYVPALFLCYFIPGAFNSVGVIDGDASRLYFVSSRYLLPACLVMLTLSVDLPSILRLGYKPLALFLTGTVGIVIGGPIALLITSSLFPDALGVSGPDAVWRGLSTLAGSWIGGGANMTAMKEVFEVGDVIFPQIVAVDVIWANIWMAVLLYLATNSARLDARMGADVSAIEELKAKVQKFQAEQSRPSSFHELIFITAIGFGVTGLAHVLAGVIAPWIGEVAPVLGPRLSLTSEFFWIVVIATTLGVFLSFTRARNLEGAGASKVGSVLLYILIASIGMHIDVTRIADVPELFVVGGIWISIHAILLLTVARALRAPLFYMAVGSQANVGGAASAPVVAAAFHPSLAPVGVLLAVLGYAVGTYAAWLCGQILRAAAGGG